MNNEMCVACDSENISVITETKDERPNGENMQLFECKDCGQVWKE